MKQTMLKQCLMSVLLLGALVLSGCGASKLTADLELNKNFVPPRKTEENESIVYVIRQSTMLGAARGLYVGLNENLICNIGSGRYCHFIIDDSVNTLNLEQTVPFGYTRLDGRKGESIFLYFEMTTGKLMELQEDIGMTAVMNSDEASKIAPKDNLGYESALFNPDLLGLYLMKPTDQILQPDGENAIITFIRPQSWAQQMGFGIWDSNGFLGNLRGETYFQVKLLPGKYSFVAKSEHYAVLEAEVEAGKNYYVQVAANMGWSQAHIKLLPVNEETGQDVVEQWLSNSKKMQLDLESLDELVNKRLALAQPKIQEALSRVQKNQAESRYLKVSDGR
ncbi:MAG: hypothetical protein V2I36_07140 [Desulfopila sp.]|jgi:hypothetical protein|nr:hypothetical protein [Desulfopila sp.]